MARVKTVFYGSELSGEEKTELNCYCNANNEIYINITNPLDQDLPAFIALDKETAIKLVKHLKQQIGIINANEGGL